MAPQGGRYSYVDSFAVRSPAELRIDGQIKMDWQEKYMLIIDEVSTLGARTLYSVNEQLCRLQELHKTSVGSLLCFSVGISTNSARYRRGRSSSQVQQFNGMKKAVSP